MQRDWEASPEEPDHVPDGHGEHCKREFAPAVLLQVPGGHALQERVEGAAQYPLGQHTEDAELENNSEPQAIQDEDAVAPVVVLYVLAAQALHDVVPGLDQYPMLQHTPEPRLLNLETGQFVVADKPVVGQKVFEGQLIQDANDVAPAVVL